MKKAVIWDLDGTLFDSYDVIVESIYLTLMNQGIAMDLEQIHQFAIRSSIKALFAKIAQTHGISSEILHGDYSRISTGKFLQIKPMPNAIEVLERLKKAGVENLVFTHRGKTTQPVLENLKMSEFFKEVVTSQNGFARKPNPEGLNYLIDKYDLDVGNTWYVGDRTLDMECAKNSGISGILYLPQGAIDVSGGAEDYVVTDLLEIINIVLS